MEALYLEHWPIDRFKAYWRNPRKNDEVVDMMVDSIKEFGFRIPIVAQSDGLVVDGHLRLKAALRLGLTEVPVVLADGLTEAQVKAFRLLANESANWAKWDEELLAIEVESLRSLDYDIGLTGFSAKEVDELLGAGLDFSPPAPSGGPPTTTAQPEDPGQEPLQSGGTPAPEPARQPQTLRCPKCGCSFGRAE